MRRFLLVTALCAAQTALAPGAQAQERIRTMTWGRPRIGVTVDMRPDSVKDKLINETIINDINEILMKSAY